MNRTVRSASPRLAGGLAHRVAIIALLAGCAPEPAPEPPPPKPEAAEETNTNNAPISTVQKQPEGPATAATSPAAAVEPTPPAEPVATSPIEDAPIIGTPQEAFNFPRPPLEMPKVLLTEAEQTSSLVKVGDALPPIELPDMQGTKQQLSSLFGKKLTVVVFWNSQNPYSVEELGDLGPMTADRFGPFGVKVVGINERDPEAAARDAIAASGVKFPNLLDSDGKAFDKVASGDLPRTYLLDAVGKILWFDLEYSRSTRRELKQAIQCALLRENANGRAIP
jgi:peroxiredoxin